MLILLILVASAQSLPVVIEVPPATAAPGHLAAPQVTENAAILARNAALIDRLEQAVQRGARRISVLVDKIEQARIARGEPPSPPSPPPPPPPYIELATIAQQTDHIAQLRDQLVRQQRVTPQLERSLQQLSRRQGN